MAKLKPMHNAHVAVSSAQSKWCGGDLAEVECMKHTPNASPAQTA